MGFYSGRKKNIYIQWNHVKPLKYKTNLQLGPDQPSPTRTDLVGEREASGPWCSGCSFFTRDSLPLVCFLSRFVLNLVRFVALKTDIVDVIRALMRSTLEFTSPL